MLLACYRVKNNSWGASSEGSPMAPKHKAVSPAKITSEAKGKDVKVRPRYFSPKIELSKGRESIGPRIRKGWVS